MTYYVVGIANTRNEFYPRGVTRSRAKAEKFSDKLESETFEASKTWIEILEVKGI